VNRDAVEQAADRFRDGHAHFIRETPLWKLPGAALGIECREVWLKLEHLQTSGSFKARGMLNRLLSNPIPAAGVIVASGGNAGIATAAAARALGVRCEVFVPTVCSAAKQAACASWAPRWWSAARLCRGAGGLPGAPARDRRAAHARLRPARGGHRRRHAGREIERQAAACRASVLVSVGGGGLIAGIAAWFEDRTRIVALEPELAPTLYRARQAGEPVDVAGQRRRRRLAGRQAHRFAGVGPHAALGAACAAARPTTPSARPSCGCGRN
jgi:threonine dehydratase